LPAPDACSQLWDPVACHNFPAATIGAYKYKVHDPNGLWVLWERREDWL